MRPTLFGCVPWQVEKDIAEEERGDAAMRSLYGPRWTWYALFAGRGYSPVGNACSVASADLNAEIVTDVARYKSLLRDARSTDATVKTKIMTHRTAMTALMASRYADVLSRVLAQAKYRRWAPLRGVFCSSNLQRRTGCLRANGVSVQCRRSGAWAP